MTSPARAKLMPIDIVKRDWPELMNEILNTDGYYRLYKGSGLRFYLVECSPYAKPRDAIWLSRHSKIKEVYHGQMPDNWIGFKRG